MCTEEVGKKREIGFGFEEGQLVLPRNLGMMPFNQMTLYYYDVTLLPSPFPSLSKQRNDHNTEKPGVEDKLSKK